MQSPCHLRRRITLKIGRQPPMTPVAHQESPMTSIMHNVDQRTQLAGRNRMELLLFRLNGNQRFGINVFKVREVINTPRLVRIPKASPIVRGIAHIRGKTIPVLDLCLATSRRPLAVDASSVIITEYNRSVQGFLVAGVDRIVNMNWKDVMPPPSGSSRSGYVTAVAKVEGELVQIIDVEKVLDEVNPAAVHMTDVLVDQRSGAEQHHVLAVDDSVVARSQIKRTLEKVGVELTLATNGEEGLQILKQWADAADSPLNRLLMVISDVEMPRMDGYTLTTSIRQDDRLQHLHVLLHTSLSGMFNADLVQRVGASDFLAKFHPKELADRVVARMEGLAEPA
jgi:two-component system chemotaxis response regulator CheV